MDSLLADEAPRTRPEGLRLIAFACFALAAYLLVEAVLILAGVLSVMSGRYLLGELTTRGIAVYALIAALLALLGVGLLQGWRFARRLGVLMAALLMAMSLLPVSAAVMYFQIVPLIIHGGKIILAVMAIRYLTQREVVDYFSATTGRRST